MWLVGDRFAEGVEGDGDAFAVELLRGGDGLLDGHAGDEAVRDAAADGGVLGELAEGFVGGEADEEGTKHAGESLGHRSIGCRPVFCNGCLEARGGAPCMGCSGIEGVPY